MNVTVYVTLELNEPPVDIVTVFQSIVPVTSQLDVLAGKRTILDYLWKPMAKVKERAFTD